ncbi:MAG TPA: hypothetical protein VJW20_20650 [Candidatus Angelobacter sp.]|nr:hypothetical protein [Candidatus Angelobacter sp.]
MMARARGLQIIKARPTFTNAYLIQTKTITVTCITPVDESIFRLAMEAWAIWKRWEQAFHAGGETMIATHPALPEDAVRHSELKQVLDGKLQSSPDAIIRLGKFVAVENTDLPKGMIRPLQVQWSNPNYQPGSRS